MWNVREEVKRQEFGWKSVKEGLPPFDEIVLIMMDGEAGLGVMPTDGDDEDVPEERLYRIKLEDLKDGTISHWMRIPLISNE